VWLTSHQFWFRKYPPPLSPLSQAQSKRRARGDLKEHILKEASAHLFLDDYSQAACHTSVASFEKKGDVSTKTGREFRPKKGKLFDWMKLPQFSAVCFCQLERQKILVESPREEPAIGLIFPSRRWWGVRLFVVIYLAPSHRPGKSRWRLS
jgi:hypothetical protein